MFEFVQPARFSLPKSRRKWSARIKNNLFYYHVSTNVPDGRIRRNILRISQEH